MIASVKVNNRDTSSLNSALVEISLMISEILFLSARSNRLHNKITLKYFKASNLLLEISSLILY